MQLRLSLFPVKWQHLLKPVADLRESDWDELGENGWELVTVDRGIAHFKRPKPALPDDTLEAAHDG